MRNHNETLDDIIWTMEAMPGVFSLMLARCDYPELRDRLIELLREKCSLRVRSVVLRPDVIRLSDAISEAVGDVPDALSVSEF